MGFFDDLIKGDIPGINEFEIANTLGEITSLGLQPKGGFFRKRAKTENKDLEGGAPAIAQWAAALGLPDRFKQIKSEGLNAENLQSLVDTIAQIQQLQSDPQGEVIMEALSNPDLASDPDFLNRLLSASTPTEEEAATEEDNLAALSERMLNLQIETQESELQAAKEDQEREGIMAFLDFLPTRARLTAMSSLVQQPNFQRLFFPGVAGTAGGLGSGGGLGGGGLNEVPSFAEFLAQQQLGSE